MSAFENAPCVGLSWLFDSTDPADHLDAKRRCARCPALTDCEALLTAELDNPRSGGGPRGTWAGRLVGETFRWTPNPREHGTDRGYHQHRHYGEPACDTCLAGHAAAQRERQVAS